MSCYVTWIMHGWWFYLCIDLHFTDACTVQEGRQLIKSKKGPKVYLFKYLMGERTLEGQFGVML